MESIFRHRPAVAQREKCATDAGNTSRSVNGAFKSPPSINRRVVARLAPRIGLCASREYFVICWISVFPSRMIVDQVLPNGLKVHARGYIYREVASICTFVCAAP